MDENIKREILNEYCNGNGTVYISKKYHTSPKKVKKILLELGVDIHDINRTVGPKVVKPEGFWEKKEHAEDAARQCRNKSEYGRIFRSAYESARKNGWLEDFADKYFSSRPEYPSLDSKIHYVYAYEIQKTKSVYVGRTTNVKRRDLQHRKGIDNDTIYKYCTGNTIDIPEPKILESGLTGYESQIEEDRYIQEYANSGWKVLNIARTGKNIGSLGATTPKWTYEACKEAASKCKNKEEYKRLYSRAHNVSRANGWIDEFFPIPYRVKDGTFDTLEGCMNASKGFKTIMQIRKEYPFLYHKISKNGWTEQIREYIGENEASVYNERMNGNGTNVITMNNIENWLPDSLFSDEKEFFEVVKGNFNDEVLVDCGTIPGKVLVLRCDSIRLIFVYVNVHEFGNAYNNVKNSELSKYVKFGKYNNFRVIEIYDSEFIHNRGITENKIKYFLKSSYISSIKVYARECMVNEIKKTEAESFLNQNHIQGFASASVYLGGFYNGELVGVMTFKHGGVNTKNEWDLNRFATKNGFICVGLGGKLFMYFIRKYNPSDVCSFADRRWGITADNLYTKLGFKFEHETPISYSYFNRNDSKGPKLYHKLLFGKSIAMRKFGKTGIINKDMTELEMARELGYDRIWDCGLIKYVWKAEK